jgi:hypothetical protein
VGLLDMTYRSTELDDGYRPEWLTQPASAFEAPETAGRMLFLAWGFLRSLPPELRTQVQYDLDDPRRLHIDAIPRPDRAGVPLTVLDPHQRAIAHSLIRSGLSMRGYTQALAIMALENVLRERDVMDVLKLGVAAAEFRDPDDYRIAFFGRPGFEDTWGWHVLGHHLFASYTIIRERYLAVTPNSMGAEPAEIGILKPVGVEEDLAFAVLETMSPALREQAVVHDVAPPDLVTRWVPRIGKVELPDHTDLGIPFYEISDADREQLKFERDHPAGISLDRLDPAGRDLVRRLLDWYFERFPDEVANGLRRRLADDEPQDIFFAWAGAEHRGAPHYYRLQTRGFVVEFVNSIDSGNHIHGVLRELDYDLGYGLLKQHHAQTAQRGHNLNRRLISSVPADDDDFAVSLRDPSVMAYTRPGATA